MPLNKPPAQITSKVKGRIQQRLLLEFIQRVHQKTRLATLNIEIIAEALDVVPTTVHRELGRMVDAGIFGENERLSYKTRSLIANWR